MPDSDNDSLFGYGIDDEDFLGLGETNAAAERDTSANAQSRGRRDDLGLDDDLVVRTRKPNVKLTAETLMGPSGIKKIRKEAPEKLKFKGKGYEYRDAARLLAYYRYWADDLFKKGRFQDTCALVEKLGHTRVVKQQREEWLSDAALGRDSREIEMERDMEDDVARQHQQGEGAAADGGQGQHTSAGTGSAGSGTAAATSQQQRVPDDPNALFKGGFPDSDDDLMMDDDDDIDLDALLEAQRANDKPGLVETVTKNTGASGPTSASTATATTRPPAAPKSSIYNGPPPPDEYDGPPPPEEEEDFEDEMEAMREFM